MLFNSFQKTLVIKKKRLKFLLILIIMSASAHHQRKTSKEDLETKTKPNSTKTRSFTHWDKFWHDAVKENEQKMRDANRAHFKKTGDQKFQDFDEGIDSDRAYMDACHKLDRGVPRYAVTLSCSGCGCEKSKDAMMRLECAQCLEMYKERKMKVVVDAFERAFFCSENCYVEHWKEHRMRHGPAYSRATKENGEVHRFEAHDEGCGALWDHGALKRKYFHECEPNTKWGADVNNTEGGGQEEEEKEEEEDNAVDSDKENEETF